MKSSMALSPNKYNKDTVKSSSSNDISVSQKSKMKKIQLSITGKSDNSKNNKRVGLPKPQISKNTVVIDLENDSPSPVNPKISKIAELYEAKLRKIERIKPVPQTSTGITRFFDESRVGNDDSDFDSRPMPTIKTPIPKKKVQKSTRMRKNGRGENLPDIRKLVNPNYSKDSKISPSQEEQRIREPLKASQDLNETTSESSAKRLRVTLEQYGFKGAKNYEECDITALFGPTTNAKRKKIRPTLLMKKDYLEQQRILTEKVSKLLETEYKENVVVPISQQLKYEPVSFFLENCIESISEIFSINSNSDPIDKCMKFYYSTGLFPISDVKAGYLLKDWAAIPGRERSVSPEPKEDTNIKDAEPENESMSMEIDKSLNESQEKMEVVSQNLTQNVSYVCQKDLDNIQASLVHTNSSLAGSCEDLFADFDQYQDNDMICTEADSIDEEGKWDF